MNSEERDLTFLDQPELARYIFYPRKHHGTLRETGDTYSLSISINEDIKIVYTTSGLSDEALKLAILQLSATYYDNRSDFTNKSVNEIPTNVQSILDPFKYISDI